MEAGVEFRFERSSLRPELFLCFLPICLEECLANCKYSTYTCQRTALMKDSSICAPVILFYLTSVSSLPVFYLPPSRTLFQRKMELRAASACGRKLCLCIHPAEGMQQLSKSCVTGSDYLPPSLFPFLCVFLPSTEILKSLLWGLSTGDSLWTKLDMVCPHANY